jgi:alkanesulfonate monooxygenase SsuD/methylene tetrahydromethanopterin reductase-like flavin-dependent oxidoreductase (luciferase family)
MSEKPIKFGVFYDFRNPEQFRQDWTDRYRQIFDQIDWVENDSNFDAVSVSEHHFADDGYTPSVLAFATAIAAKTERLEIATNILQMPLHNPLRVAEDSLTIDALSGGRFRLGIAIGYRELEFEAFETTTRHRGERMDEAIEILRGAFSGEPFSHQGKHWSFPELRVTPLPVRPGGPPIWVGGTARRALDRAARAGDGFMASVNDEVVGFLQACERADTPAERRGTMRTAWSIIAEDPEKALDELGPYMLHQVNVYIDFGFLKVPYFEDPQVLVDQGFYTLTDAGGAISSFREAADAGVEEIHLFAMIPGEPVESGAARLQYVSDKVIPAFQPVRS